MARKTKTKSKPGRKPKLDKTPELAMRAPSKGNAQNKALFLDHHLPKIARQKGVLATAQANLRNAYKAAKVDGFLKRDFEIAIKLQTETGEREIKALIARDGLIAKWLGKQLGKQLDMFSSMNEVDPEEAAYIAGQVAATDGKPSEPPLPAGEPAFDAYLRGYNDHAQAPKSEPSKPSSGVPMTRSQFRAQQVAAKKADKYIEPAPMFTKRSPDEAAE